jgi:hypothetical protein
MRKATLAVCALGIAMFPLTACSKSSGSSGGTAASASAPAVSAAAAKPAPPPDGATTCVVTLTGNKITSGKDPALEYKLKNAGSRPLRFCQIYTYAYDKTGNVAGRGSLSENHDLKPGEEYTSSFGLSVSDDKGTSVVNGAGLTFVSYVEHVIFQDNSEWEDTKFDTTKGPGPAGAAAASGAPSASAAPTAAPAVAATGGPARPGRPPRPAPPLRRQ